MTTEATPEEIEQAAKQCVATVRKGVTLSAAVRSLQVIRNWDTEICKEVEQRATHILKRQRN